MWSGWDVFWHPCTISGTRRRGETHSAGISRWNIDTRQPARPKPPHRWMGWSSMAAAPQAGFVVRLRFALGGEVSRSPGRFWGRTWRDWGCQGISPYRISSVARRLSWRSEQGRGSSLADLSGGNPFSEGPSWDHVPGRKGICPKGILCRVSRCVGGTSESIPR